MSIIHEALKKTETAINPQPQLKPAQEAKQPKTDSKSSPLYLYAFVAVAAIVIGNVVFTFLGKTKNPLPVTVRPQTVTRQAPSAVSAPEAQQIPAVNAPSASPKVKESDLILNGIFFSQDEGYALINNQIVREGDRIAGATIKQITPKEVELENSGGTFRLKTE